MSEVKSGDTVKVHYTGKLEDNTVFDSSRNRQPLEFTVGGGNVIPGFEKAIVGMNQGETKSFTIPPEEAYGQRRDDLLATVNKADFPEHITPEVGQELQVKQPDGNVVKVIVSAIEDQDVTLDANHPLAGKTLIFDVELVEVA